MRHRLLASILFLMFTTACSNNTQLAPQPHAKNDAITEISIFSINDLHGHLQATNPVPIMVNPDGKEGGAIPAGGYAYLAHAIKEARKDKPNSIVLGAGDMIGATPIGSALLKDEPVFEALNQLDLTATSLGNHEFDIGSAALLEKIRGKCASSGCNYPQFRGANFEYLGANVIDKKTGKNWIKPYLIKQVGDVKVGIIGAVTVDTTHLVAGDGVKDLHFEDEATAINRYVPEIKQQGATAIIVLIHEGANYRGAANDPSYQCNGLQGPMVEMMPKLDPAVTMVISGHTHQAYTCKIGGRLLVQARSYGAYFTETTLTIDKNQNRVVSAKAVNHLIDQEKLHADADAQKLVDQVIELTKAVQARPIAQVTGPLNRQYLPKTWDSVLGNVAVDGQLTYARTKGPADIAMMNSGSIRNDLPSGKRPAPITLTYGDLFAVQPFGNGIMRMKMTGAQIIKVLQQQWTGRALNDPKKMFVSAGFSYQWKASPNENERISQVKLNGKALDLDQQYIVIVNSFLADGGDGFTLFKTGTEREEIGRDIDALEFYIKNHTKDLLQNYAPRVIRAE
ncbi:bifunctional metallophosphatase/5'-nucleotidase [Undibacterium cyanobacteriorum]|uniref:Bifunctional metallophosphatase/5'-nucleotidase n=1 Tax=Undibacterium cyanobacteriorum TaxID=3073561 RepID=A0ABY9RJP1_9BURK|nr:bifunctional metallophosphatase/5'-nucleotidase [Undibacterium sp. 20NA77.5]WMW81049.1 bifunctional metallophosphatase/5'-nucleotidase [Undibacterium sp. 20NA77.5]